MPRICPFTSALNFVPSSIEPGSPWSTVFGTVLGDQMVHPVQLTSVGVTGLDDAETAPAPTALVAATVKVYAVPLVRPLTVTVVSGGVPVTVVGVFAVVPS